MGRCEGWGLLVHPGHLAQGVTSDSLQPLRSRGQRFAGGSCYLEPSLLNFGELCLTVGMGCITEVQVRSRRRGT